MEARDVKAPILMSIKYKATNEYTSWFEDLPDTAAPRSSAVEFGRQDRTVDRPSSKLASATSITEPLHSPYSYRSLTY
eukprot:4856807-Pleurochrysis_carterae.AAC.8